MTRDVTKEQTMAKSDAKGRAKEPANKARRYWAPRDRLPVVADVLAGRRNYLDACRHYGAQSNQVYAWAGQAILTERPEALQAIASNRDLMQRLTALATALPVGRQLSQPASEREADREIVARLLRLLGEPSGASGRDPVLESSLHRILGR